MKPSPSKILPDHLIIKSIYWLSALLVLSIALWILSNQWFLIGGGFLLSFMLTPLVNLLERKGIQRTLGSVITLIFAGISLYLFFLFVEPLILSHFDYFNKHQNLFYQKIAQISADLKNLAQPLLGEEVIQRFDSKTTLYFTEQKTHFQEQLPIWLGTFASFLSSALFLPVVAFFFLSQGYQMKQKFMTLIPNRYFEMTMMLLYQFQAKLGGYLRGQLMDCLVIGLLAFVGLSIIGVKGALVIGLFAGLANAIPYLGPVVGALPAIAMLLIDPNPSAPWWAVPIVFLIVNLLDNLIVYPMTVGRSLDLNPLLVIITILFGGSVAGVIGMIIAVPLMAIGIKCFGVMHHSLKSYRVI